MQHLTFRFLHGHQRAPRDETFLLSLVAWAPVPSPFRMLERNEIEIHRNVSTSLYKPEFHLTNS